MQKKSNKYKDNMEHSNSNILSKYYDTKIKDVLEKLKLSSNLPHAQVMAQ